MVGDIRLATTFLRHPKTRRLRRRLGADGALSLIALWIFAAESRPSGVLSGLDPADIEEVADWTGEKGAFVDALVEIRFLDHESGVYLVHDWVENNPWAAGAEARSTKARKAAQARWESQSEIGKECSEDPTSMPAACQQQCPFPLLSSPKEDLSEPAIPTCPHERIVEIYHETLPELPRVQLARWHGSARARDLQTRWREDERHRDLKFWCWLFEGVRANPFYLGDNPSGWRADLGWLLKRRNFDKLVECIADQRRRATP